MYMWCQLDNVSHTVVESCPLTKWDGGLKKLHTADNESVDRLSFYGTSSAYANNNNNHALEPLGDHCGVRRLCLSKRRKPLACQSGLQDFSMSLSVRAPGHGCTLCSGPNRYQRSCSKSVSMSPISDVYISRSVIFSYPLAFDAAIRWALIWILPSCLV